MSTQHHTPPEALPAGTRPEIHGQVDRILQSPPFRTSRQCQDLFRYVVEHSLNGYDDSLRERVIGVEVFGRAPDYDTAEDPVVRLRAADVRKRLAQYYQARHNEPGHWKIEIPTGSYKAQFHPVEAPSSQGSAPASEVLPQRVLLPESRVDVAGSNARRDKQKRLALLILLAGVVATLFATLALTRKGPPVESALDQFWKPILRNKGPVLLCTGSNRVYRLSEQARYRYRKSHPRSEDDTPNFESLVPREDLKKFTGDDFVPVKNTYLTIGDASATAEISSLFTSHERAYDLRFGSDLSFGDLRQGSAVLIGAFNNSWTLQMTDSLRFVFEDGDTPQMHLKDRTDTSRMWWPKFSEGKFSDDYAIVSRILDVKTGSALVTIAGLGHFGTHAAGDFVTNPQMIADLVRQLPRDWSSKNMQIVLHTDVVNDIAAPPTIVASYSW
jgi:hypothetical protein